MSMMQALENAVATLDRLVPREVAIGRLVEPARVDERDDRCDEVVGVPAGQTAAGSVPAWMAATTCGDVR